MLLYLKRGVLKDLGCNNEAQVRLRSPGRRACACSPACSPQFAILAWHLDRNAMRSAQTNPHKAPMDVHSHMVTATRAALQQTTSVV